MYYYDKSNMFRPNRKELHNGLFNCPKCKNMMSTPRTRILEVVYVCPSCGHKIKKEKVLNTHNLINEHKENKRRLIEQVMNENF